MGLTPEDQRLAIMEKHRKQQAASGYQEAWTAKEVQQAVENTQWKKTDKVEIRLMNDIRFVSTATNADEDGKWVGTVEMITGGASVTVLRTKDAYESQQAAADGAAAKFGKKMTKLLS
jgi:hypothetical protein